MPFMKKIVTLYLPDFSRMVILLYHSIVADSDKVTGRFICGLVMSQYRRASCSVIPSGREFFDKRAEANPPESCIDYTIRISYETRHNYQTEDVLPEQQKRPGVPNKESTKSLRDILLLRLILIGIAGSILVIFAITNAAPLMN